MCTHTRIYAGLQSFLNGHTSRGYVCTHACMFKVRFLLNEPVKNKSSIRLYTCMYPLENVATFATGIYGSASQDSLAHVANDKSIQAYINVCVDAGTTKQRLSEALTGIYQVCSQRHDSYDGSQICALFIEFT